VLGGAALALAIAEPEVSEHGGQRWPREATRPRAVGSVVDAERAGEQGLAPRALASHHLGEHGAIDDDALVELGEALATLV
jgi:hypothetical protein